MNLADAVGADYAEGVFTLRNGCVGHTSATKQTDGCYLVRYESGWYCKYRNDGTCVSVGQIIDASGNFKKIIRNSGRDIVKFDPIDYETAKAKYPGINTGFHP